jgi:hypothetical protein
MEDDKIVAQAVHDKVDDILLHGDPAMREMIRDLIFEFHNQIMNDPKSRASMKERMKSLGHKVIKFPLVFKPEKSLHAPSTPKIPLIKRNHVVAVTLFLLFIIFVPWSKVTSWRGQNVPVRICNFKGNITNLGEKIYHRPDSKWYDKTFIDESKGERWFCSEDEARGAGWRVALD